MLGLALIGALAVAWMWVGRGAATGGPVPTTTGAVPAPEPRVEPIVAVPRWVPGAIAATCGTRRGDGGSSVVVDCTPGRGVVALRYRGFASIGALRAAYDASSPRGGGEGVSECARGATEERSWSEADSPAVPEGRYRCSLVEGRAQLVWSSEGARVLAIASRADDDLRSLYEWWTTVPGPDDP